MPKVAVIDITGKQVGDYELSEAVFGQPVNEYVLHEVVKAHLANCRQGTQSELPRAEVRGGGIKPWRQKGTGRARQGSTRSPQWRHGGVVFAPKPRDYTVRVNKKVKRLAMKSALSSKVVDNDVVGCSERPLPARGPRPARWSGAQGGRREKALIVAARKRPNVERAAANIPAS